MKGEDGGRGRRSQEQTGRFRYSLRKGVRRGFETTRSVRASKAREIKSEREVRAGEMWEAFMLR